MNDPIAIFPDETYLKGLGDGDASVVDAMYNEFRQPVTRAVESLGGTYADGNIFFRVALIHTARLTRTGRYPEGAPVYLFLKNLALSQYRDWLQEKGQALPELKIPTEAEIPVFATLPHPTELLDMRKQIRAKRQFARLSAEDQARLLTLAKTTEAAKTDLAAMETEPLMSVIERYKDLLEERDQAWESSLPNWVVSPLTDTHFHQIWAACEALERRSYSSQVPQTGENKAMRYAFLTILMLTIGYAVFTWFNRDRSPEQVYESNFQPPESIAEDMAMRYSKDSIAPVQPEACTIAFSRADAFYKRKEWREAAEALVGMMEDSLATCQSDALFYLAIVGLQMDRPGLTIDCIAKIEDLERYGEDIYWYMALAYVKIAAADPSEKDIARRAVERALSNTEIPERRAKAEKMLEELGD